MSKIIGITVGTPINTRKIVNDVEAATKDQFTQLSKTKADKAGWTPDMYIGTDAEGNLVEKEAPTSGTGTPGEDGYSPSAVVEETDTGATITITDKTGTTTATIINGKDGADGSPGKDGQDGTPGKDGSDGADGISPTVTVSKSGKVTTVSITDKNGTKTATINDGEDGSPGSTGKDGTSVTVKSVSESTADGGDNIVTFSDGNTLTVKNGKTGAKGDTGDTGATGATGATGQRGTGLLPITTAPSTYTTAVNGITPAYRIALSTIKTQSSATEVFAGDTVRYSYYHYPVVYVDSSYAYCGTRVSIRGATGKAGSDATVTAENIGTALGYTPADQNDVDSLTETKADKTYLITMFEELKTALNESNLDAAIAVLDKAILDFSALS